MVKFDVSRKIRAAVLGGAVSVLAITPAFAGGLEMPEPGRKLELSANVALGTEYVFRGITQTDENATIQGGFDMTYGTFYAGVWGSNLDFGACDSNGDTVPDADCADIEIDVYAGFAPSYKGLNFDIGVIWYGYPNAVDAGAELDYLEIKGGVSGKPVDPLTVGFTVFYSPDYTGEVGDNWVFETSAELSLPKVGSLSPSLSGLVGYQEGDENDGGVDYTYWNVGLSVGFAEKFTVDVRYWDSDLSGLGTAADERVVGTLSASF